MKNSSMVCLGLFCLMVMVISGCGASEGAKKTQSNNNMKQILLACFIYQGNNDNAWPDNLDDLKGNGIDDADWNALTINPINGEYPGYEYIKPKDSASPSTTVVLYQLDDGQRDMSLAVGYADASVREPGQ